MVGEIFHDYAQAAEYAARQDATGNSSAVYINLNRLRPDVEGAPPSKKDIAAFTNLLIDIDRRGKDDMNASDQELAELLTFKDLAAEELNTEFGTRPVEIFTGNGYGLIFRLEKIPTGDEAIVKQVLERLRNKFDSRGPTAIIDTSVGDPQRLTRLCGTWNRKFPETEGRPHRRATLLIAPELRYSIAWRELRTPSVATFLEIQSDGSRALPPVPAILEARAGGPHAVPLKQEVDFRAALTKKLIFETHAGPEGTYYDYHGLVGQPCLVAGHVHSQNVGNPRCSAFVETNDHRIYHTCFAEGCRAQHGVAKTRLALKSIGLANLVPVDDGTDWRERCHNFFELTTELPKHIVENLLPEKCLTIFSAPSYHGKTFTAQDTARSMVTGAKLFGHFAVPAPVPVFYHVPEMNESLFRHRLSQFHYGNLPDKEMFLCRTMEDGAAWALDSAEMRLSSAGRVVFLDTMMYFNEAVDAASYAEVRRFAEQCFTLLAKGCLAIVALYHPTKFAAGQDEMTLQNYVLGSAGYGGILGSCLGFRCLNPETLHIYIQQLKARGIPLRPFQIERGADEHFYMKVPPTNESPYLKDLLAPSGDDRYERAYQMFEQKFSHAKIAAILHVSKSTVGKWAKAWKEDREHEERNAQMEIAARDF